MHSLELNGVGNWCGETGDGKSGFIGKPICIFLRGCKYGLVREKLIKAQNTSRLILNPSGSVFKRQ